MGTPVRGISLRSTLFAAVAILSSCKALADALASDTATLPQVIQCEGSAPAADRVKACANLLDGGALTGRAAAMAHFFRAFAELDLQQAEPANNDFNEAIRLYPDLWPASWARAEMRDARREYQGAAADWTEVIRWTPQVASAYVNRGTAFDYLGRGEESIADFTKAIEIETSAALLAQLYLERANAYEGLYDWDKALADYTEALHRNDSLRAANRGLARVEIMTGDIANARSNLAKVDNPREFDGYDALWLFVADARAGENPLGKLRQRAAKLDLRKWPGPVVQTLLGAARPEQIVPPADPGTWSEADRTAGAQCELSFYLGESYLFRGERDKAVAMFRAAVATGFREYIEYRMAAYELRRLSP
jgi:lipoprotein NlpI